jgi:hypothetical protein
MINRIILTLSLLVFSSVALAEAPGLMPVQGHVLGMDDKPVEGEMMVKFALYAAPNDAEAVYEETQPVTFRGGHFFAYLGDGGQLDLALFRDNSGLYLGMALDSDAEMEPRIFLASAAYAAFAQHADDSAKLGGRDAAEYALKTETGSWMNLADIPEGFMDGIDNDTTYTAATGLDGVQC